MAKPKCDVMAVPQNGRILLDELSLTRDLLHLLPRVPISSSALQILFRVIASTLPFDEDFYAETYPDLALARATGSILDLRQHYLDHGYLEGRLGAPVDLDEAFYLSAYSGVSVAIENGQFASALDHYLRSGSSEGRFANAHDRDVCNRWRALLAGE